MGQQRNAPPCGPGAVLRCALAQLQFLRVQLHFQLQPRPQPRRRRTDASLSPAVPLIGTSEQPVQRARRTCQRPLNAATPVSEERKYRVERGGRVRDGKKNVLNLQRF